MWSGTNKPEISSLIRKLEQMDERYSRHNQEDAFVRVII